MKLSIRAIHLFSVSAFFVLSSSTTLAQTSDSPGDKGCGFLGYGNSQNILSKKLSNGHPDSVINNLFRLHEKMINALMTLKYPPILDFMDDRTSPNALAFPRGSLSNAPHILMGVSLMDGKVGTTIKGETNFSPSIAVLMHEFAHIGQYEENLQGNLLNRELMADAISGWYVAVHVNLAAGQNGLPPLEGRVAALDAMRSTYDSGSYQYHDPNFHGTPNDRLSAFKYGYALYDQRDLDFWDAFHAAAAKFKMN